MNTVGEIWDKKWEKFDIHAFKENAFLLDPWTTYHRALIEKYMKKIDHGGVFLEAGCGMGHWCFFAAERYGIRSVGADIAEETIARLQKSANNLTTFIVDDLNDSRLNTGSFDMFVSLGVIEHFKDSNPMMRNLYRVLKPGGIGIITVPNIYSIHTITRPILQFLHKWDVGYEKSFSPVQLKELALRNDFTVIEYGILPSGELLGCFLNNLPLVGGLFKKVSFAIEKRQRTFGFISFAVVQKINH